MAFYEMRFKLRALQVQRPWTMTSNGHTWF